VVLDAYADRSRYVAPSYGFELAQLVYHGRRAWRVNLLQHFLVLGITGVGLWISPLAVVFAAGFAMIWYVASSGLRLAAGRCIAGRSFCQEIYCVHNFTPNYAFFVFGNFSQIQCTKQQA
jgi:hypothetical protein